MPAPSSSSIELPLPSPSGGAASTNQADPDNRLSAARAWRDAGEAALRDLKDAEEKRPRDQQQPRASRSSVPRNARPSPQAGKIPAPRQGRLTPPQQKKPFAAPHRQAWSSTARSRYSGPHCLERVTTTASTLPVTVGAAGPSVLSQRRKWKKKIIRLAKAGKTDEEITAAWLTQRRPSPTQARTRPAQHRPHPPPQASAALASRSHPHPATSPVRHLTVFQPHPHLGDHGAHWIYDRIHNRMIQVASDPITNLYLFPDQAQDNNLVPATSGWQTPEVAFLGGVSTCVIEAPLDIAFDEPFKSATRA